MMKVLYLLNHAGKAGTETYVQSLVDRLQGKKIQAYFAYNEEGLLAERLRAKGIETHKVVMRHRLDIKAAWDLSRLCKKLGIDLIHNHYPRENYVSIMSRVFNPSVKVVYTNHFVLRDDPLVRFLNRFLIPFDTNIIAVCNRGKQMLVSNGMPADKIRVIFNGVDPAQWGNAEKSTLREELGIDDDVFVLLCASRFAYDKGHEYLINSIAELKKITRRKFKIVLAGDGPFLEARKKQASDMGLDNEIIFAGFRKDIKNLYYGSDLYINSSAHEALSFLIIESLASGLPVIATDMGGNSDIINKETKCGILVKYDDAKELAEAIKKVMDDEKLQVSLREHALKTVREKFNLESIIAQTYNLYEDSVKR